MGKLSKYWMNFNLLVFVAVLLIAPFIPFARLAKQDKSEVLATSDMKPVGFPDVVYSKVVEASFSAGQTQQVFSNILGFKNNRNQEQRYKVVVSESVDASYRQGQFAARAIFQNGSDNVTLDPQASESVSLMIDKLGEKTSASFIVTVLSSL